jgi:hypothetical protein
MFRDILIVKNVNTTTDYSNFTAVTGDFAPSLFDLGPDVDSRPCQSPQPSDTCAQNKGKYGLNTGKYAL